MYMYMNFIVEQYLQERLFKKIMRSDEYMYTVLIFHNETI